MLNIPQHAAALRAGIGNKGCQLRRIGKQAAAFHQHPNIFVRRIAAQLFIPLFCRRQICRYRIWVEGQQNPNKRDAVLGGKVNLIFCLHHLLFPFPAAHRVPQYDRGSNHCDFNARLCQLCAGLFQVLCIKDGNFHWVDLIFHSANLQTVDSHILCSPQYLSPVPLRTADCRKT